VTRGADEGKGRPFYLYLGITGGQKSTRHFAPTEEREKRRGWLLLTFRRAESRLPDEKGRGGGKEGTRGCVPVRPHRKKRKISPSIRSRQGGREKQVPTGEPKRKKKKQNILSIFEAGQLGRKREKEVRHGLIGGSGEKGGRGGYFRRWRKKERVQFSQTSRHEKKKGKVLTLVVRRAQTKIRTVALR